MVRITVRVLRRHSFQVAAALIAVAAAWPLLSEPGLLNAPRGGGDSPFLLQRLHQLEAALREGHFPVRWMPDANYGYGYPFFNYYAPLSFYISAVFRFVGFSYVAAIRLAQLGGFLVAAIGMFWLGRRWLGSKWAGLLVSAAYTLTPFHLVNIYVRGDSLAEFWAMAFYPLIILSAEDLVHSAGRKSSRRIKIATFALAYAGLILTHNISALIFSPFLLVYFALKWWQMSRKLYLSAGNSRTPASWRSGALAPLLPVSLGLALALALAAHFFVPALWETSLAQLGPVTAGHFFYGNHFQGADLIQSDWLFDYDPDRDRAFHVGWIQAMLTAVGSVVLIFALRRRLTVNGRQSSSRRSEERPRPTDLLFTFLTLIITSMMITHLSRPLWEGLPLLPFTQFPWRFLSVQALATALVTGAIALVPLKRIVVPTVILLLLASSLGGLETAYLVLADADVTDSKLAQYEWFTGNIGSTVSAEYLPVTVQPRAYTSPWLTTGERERILPVAGELIDARKVGDRATRQTWEVNVSSAADGSQATLTFPTLFWPGWVASVDGKRKEIVPAPGSGLITLEVSPGEHTIKLRLGRTPVQLVAELISAAAVVVVAWQLRPGQPRHLFRPLLVLILALALLALGSRLWPDARLSQDDLTWDFLQMGYLHHSPEGIPFDNGAVLKRYTVSHEQIDAGETLTITLNWSATADTPAQQATLALASPAVNRFEQAPLLVSQAQPLRSGPLTYDLTIPLNAPGGLYVPRLTLDDGHALMSANRPRGDLFLRPLRVVASYDPAGDPVPSLAVRPVEVKQRNATTLDLQLALLTGRQLNQNYNISLRLADAEGMPVVQFDTQPGYGFKPSSGWPPGRWVNDWLAVSLPSLSADKAPYILTSRLYELHSGNLVLIRFLGELDWRDELLFFSHPVPVFTLPEAITRLDARFEAQSESIIRLHGYEIQTTKEYVELTLYWGALVDGRVDYTRFVHLVDPNEERPPFAQSDEMPRYNSYPTGQWVAGEVVADPVKIDLSDVPPGAYQIVVGLYRNLGDSFPRLTAVDTQGTRFAFDRVPLPVTITVEEEEAAFQSSERLFSLQFEE